MYILVTNDDGFSSPGLLVLHQALRQVRIIVVIAPIDGVAITCLGQRVYRDELIVRHDPRGRPRYWIGGGEPEGSLDDGTDTAAIANGHLSVTPTHFDLTQGSWGRGITVMGSRSGVTNAIMPLGSAEKIAP